MKLFQTQIKFTVTLLAIVTLAVSFTACGGDEDAKPASDDVKALLTASTWKMNAVTVDGTDQTDLYEDLAINFGNTTFSAVNGAGVWPNSGTWSFTSDAGTAIQRGDGLIVTIREISETILRLELSWTKGTIGPGRSQSIAGNHIFTFGK
jgi:hypothetical protein